MFSKRSLCSRCGSGCILTGAKDDEECVTFGVDLVAVMRLERSAQQAAVVREQLCVALSRTLKQLRRALDVGKEQGYGAARSVGHPGSTIARNESNWKPGRVSGAHRSRTCLASGYDSALVLKVCQVTCSRLWEGALWRRTGLHQGSILCCQRWRHAEVFTLFRSGPRREPCR